MYTHQYWNTFIKSDHSIKLGGWSSRELPQDYVIGGHNPDICYDDVKRGVICGCRVEVKWSTGISILGQRDSGLGISYLTST
ncbi:hypothetical protein N7488_002605 [Penicillium malachiteum]|nr:hypothetical protein N7488_002605 [Penicillium malachiteum]